MDSIQIKSALISVYHKDNLEPIIRALHANDVTIYSTGGTQSYIESLGIPVIAVEDLTTYPSILDGRVKTLHPGVFGGILARREPAHLAQLSEYKIPTIDLVIVDLYPFEETLKITSDESEIIEKIDIGGVSLIRAAAKNFNDVVCVASKNEYNTFMEAYSRNQGSTELTDRKELARLAFKVTSHYDAKIFAWFNEGSGDIVFKQSMHESTPLRYGENPHQQAVFYGDFDAMFERMTEKEVSYNNLVDIDAAVGLINEFKNEGPTFAILKHTNACGVATRSSILEAWKCALASDPVSAFGGILISNTAIDLETAQEINSLFYEVVIAPSFSKEALELLTKKKQRTVLRLKDFYVQKRTFRSLLNGVIEQDYDFKTETEADLSCVTKHAATDAETKDLIYAIKCVKHLKSNGIALVKNGQMIGMGCGQTSRVDSLNHAINKARSFGFDLNGAVMSSEAFFPFPDCVEIAYRVGITAVSQPGGSVKDQDSINYCDSVGLAMVMTGVRHFKH
ncbi:MAG: bifunctional phosphoribosylaminoimidazolecarboxamide formyltransferase/IMP cyclohydrolase [Saprospiraceae bacterium]